MIQLHSKKPSLNNKGEAYFYEKKTIMPFKHCSIVELFILFDAKWLTSHAAVLKYCLNYLTNCEINS
jgi:hypothetical protein